MHLVQLYDRREYLAIKQIIQYASWRAGASRKNKKKGREREREREREQAKAIAYANESSEKENACLLPFFPLQI